jgi:hypothetical protein
MIYNPYYDEVVLAKFWSNVNKYGPIVPYVGTPCWVWTGRKIRKGYGHISSKKKTLIVHRFSWLIHNGPIVNGLHVLHMCDVRNCVNPEHLYLGTEKENARDREIRGRGNHATGDRSGFRKHPELRLFGEKNPATKLTSDIVLDVYNEYRKGNTTHKELSMKFGITMSTIGRITRAETWIRLLSEE